MTKEERIKAEREVFAFNFSHPVGTPVLVSRDNGNRYATVTRSEAFVSAGGEAVIWVKGIAGYYLLSRVEPQTQPAL